MHRITKKQHDILLRAINPIRVEQRNVAGMHLSYLSQQDVRAHLIRVFGFGGFDLTTIKSELLFCDKNEKSQWDVSWLVTMQLSIKDRDGYTIAIYSESAVGSNSQPRRAEALDMALKTASSDAMKRCAINLGDQFGLSLYAKGSTDAIVKATLLDDEYEDVPVRDKVAALELPVSHGIHDEVGVEGMPLGDPTSEEEQA